MVHQWNDYRKRKEVGILQIHQDLLCNLQSMLNKLNLKLAIKIKQLSMCCVFI